MSVRSTHRAVMVLSVLLLLYTGITGSLVQGIDLVARMSGAPATDPNMRAIREGVAGPPNFVVIEDSDYSESLIPRTLNLSGSITALVHEVRDVIGNQAIDYVEVRMVDGKPVAGIQAADRVFTYDAVTGAALGAHAVEPFRFSTGKGSEHDTMKQWHRMATIFGDSAMWFELFAALSLVGLVVSGVTINWSSLRARMRVGQSGVGWIAGGWWRTLHRTIATVAVVFLLIVGVSGSLLAIETIKVSFYMKKLGLGMPTQNTIDPVMRSAASPLTDEELPMMVRATVAGLRRDEGDISIKGIRLRYYGGMPQDVVITGGSETRQLIYNASTGARAGLLEAGYPKTPFPFGWGAHEVIKRIHRGDYFGLTGQWMEFLSGVSLVFLAGSGPVIYANLWLRRLKASKVNLFW